MWVALASDVLRNSLLNSDDKQRERPTIVVCGVQAPCAEVAACIRRRNTAALLLLEIAAMTDADISPTALHELIEHATQYYQGKRYITQP